MAQIVDCMHPKTPLVDPDTGVATKFFARWLYCIWTRTGGNDDLVDGIYTQNDNAYVTDSRISNISKKTSETQLLLELSPAWDSKKIDTYQYIETSSNYTTTGKQIIIATSNVTITLNQKPKDRENCIIKRATTAGEVIVDAVSRNIDGMTTHTLLMDYECIQCVYSYAQDEWYII